MIYGILRPDKKGIRYENLATGINRYRCRKIEFEVILPLLVFLDTAFL